MAKSFSKGILILDSQGQGFSGTPMRDLSVQPDGSWTTNPVTYQQYKQSRCESITVDPSGASWSIVLTNQDGSTFFSATGSVATPVTFPGPFDYNGIVAKTMSGLNRVVLSDVQAIEW